MAWPTYAFEVAWGADLTGIFRIGVSAIGGTDTIGGPFNEAAFEAITSDVLGCSIRRGRSDDLGQVMAGECILTLKDSTGKYNPANTSSPNYSNLNPMRPLRIRATYSGTTYDLFYGFVQRIESRPSRSERRATVESADFLAWMALQKPTITSSPTTTGAAIGKILDDLQWTETAKRSLATGDTIPAFSADASRSALEYARDLLEAERGTLHVQGDGTVVYEDRNQRYRAPRDADQDTITDLMSDLRVATDAARIFNSATVTRSGGTAQTASDTTSERRYGQRPATSISTAHLNTDAEALSLATYIVVRHKNPKTPASVVLRSRDSNMVAMLRRDLNDRVGMSETLGGTSGSWFIEALEHRIDPIAKLHETVWELSRRPSNPPFLVGISTIGGPDVIER